MTTPTWQDPPTTPAEFRDRLVTLGLSEYADALTALCRQSIRLVPVDSPAEKDAHTRLGGRPLLPEHTQWPAVDGRPLSFVAQINCADGADPLPATGLLSFFYDSVEQPWGFDPIDADSWAVIYTPATERVAIRDFPAALEAAGRYVPLSLRPEVEWTFPPGESFEVEQIGIDKPWEAYGDVFGQRAGDPVVHRLLGHPDPVQGDMQHECQLASNGIRCGDSAYIEDPRAQSLLRGSSDWRLLLQIDSADDLGMMWGDVGRLYYWIRDQDLHNHAWDATWLVLQCS